MCMCEDTIKKFFSGHPTFIMNNHKGSNGSLLTLIADLCL